MAETRQARERIRTGIVREEDERCWEVMGPKEQKQSWEGGWCMQANKYGLSRGPS